MMNKLDFLKRNIHKFGKIVPCTQQDIVSLEEDLGLALPEVYKEFLLICGGESGTYLRDDFAHLKYIKEQQQFNIEMRRDCNYPTPQKGDLAILTNFDDVVNFINVTEGDDPPVYRYDRVDWPPVIAYNCLTECYYKKLDYYLWLASRLTGRELTLE